MLRFVFHFLFCMVAISWISLLCAESFHMNKCVEIERLALLNFKDAYIHGTDNPFASWKDKDCCKWKGILCDNITGHVTSLEINALGGKLDSSICELQHLTSLSLSDNEFEGNIPKCIGSLAQLIELNLAFNKLVRIPPSLGNLSNLQTLDLSYNSFMIVNDLEWLSHLSELRYLDLSFVNLSLVVDWLSPMSKIPALSHLDLSDCGLHNVTHKSIPHLNSSVSLKYLDFMGNNLNSSILPWVINVSKVLTHLDLSYNSMQHSIPDEFGNMIFLQYLALSYNELQGSIPKSFRSMCQLKRLYLHSNKLSGKLNDNIQQLCCANNSLEYLDLSDNPFTSEPLPNLSCLSSLVTLYLQHTNLVGMLPKSLFLLSSLQILDLSHNHLSGVDIIDDANLSAIRTLDLSFNQLSGPFLRVICQLSSLEALVISSNKLNDIINKTHLSNLSNLEMLDVSQNSLSFNLSSDWIPPFKLTYLFASSCQLGPKFPVWLKHQTELFYLDISNTGISDSFPKWFWNFSPPLEYLNVSHNKLNGRLPISFPNTKVNHVSFYEWDFSFNNLNGSLPTFPELRSLFLLNNMFTGSLSSFCTSLSHSLMYLDLSSNLLTGKLTASYWENFPSLIFLNLAKNNLSGKVPSSFGTLGQLESLHLNNNNFSGEIPSLILCHKLKLIDVGDNNLHGTLPIWIGHHLHQLIVIRLRANKFQGSIPTNMCNLSFLQVLDLSFNNITGEIPQCFSDIIAFSNLKFPRTSFHYLSSSLSYTRSQEYEFASFNDKAVLSLKGSNREYDKTLELVTSIDFSCNHLTGEIPQSITKLVALFGLNLSRNNLTEFIPNNFGDMESLESLDLSKNHLSGRIPSSFSNLTFLGYMNLSFNNLEGRIPLGTQLQSFDPSSYMGNAGLCGPPLINHCPEDVISPTKSQEKHDTSEDEDKLITFGFYVSLGVGFIVGFWGVCGTLVIKTSWRHAYFKFFNNINDWIQLTLAVFVIKLKRRFQVED